MSDHSDEEVGKGRPPIASRFKPGISGNPKGRPRGKRLRDPYDVVLGQMVTIRENGQERRLRADEAFMFQITAKGLAGDRVMMRAALQAFENAPSCDAKSGPRTIICGVYADEGDLRNAIQLVGIAKLLDGYRLTARLGLETWAVEEALARLGDQFFAEAQQEVVVAATRMPHKVRWPDWWSRF